MALSEVGVPPFYRGNWQGDVYGTSIYDASTQSTLRPSRVMNAILILPKRHFLFCIIIHNA